MPLAESDLTVKLESIAYWKWPLWFAWIEASVDTDLFDDRNLAHNI